MTFGLNCKACLQPFFNIRCIFTYSSILLYDKNNRGIINIIQNFKVMTLALPVSHFFFLSKITILNIGGSSNTDCIKTTQKELQSTSSTTFLYCFICINTHTHTRRERERERERAYELNIFHETLLRISTSNKFKEQHSKTVNITFLSESLCGYILRIKIPKSTPYINCVFVHHLFS